MAITAHYGKEKQTLSFDKPLSMVSLAELVHVVASAFSLPSPSVKLIFAGGVMRDMKATLAQYGMHDKSKVMVLSSNAPGASHSIAAAPLQPLPGQQALPTGINVASAEPREQAVIEALSSLVSSTLAPLNPALDRFSRIVQGASPPDQDVTKLKLELCEKLMQGLLKIDGVAVPPGFELARQKRRESVNTLQTIMDDVESHFKRLRSG